MKSAELIQSAGRVIIRGTITWEIVRMIVIRTPRRVEIENKVLSAGRVLTCKASEEM
jgi:hypothetical protein